MAKVIGASVDAASKTAVKIVNGCERYGVGSAIDGVAV